MEDEYDEKNNERYLKIKYFVFDMIEQNYRYVLSDSSSIDLIIFISI